MHLFRMHFFVDRISSGFLKKSLHDILSFDIIVKQCPGGEIGSDTVPVRVRPWAPFLKLNICFLPGW